MRTEILATLPSSIDAHMMKNKLENEGIECFLVNENFNNLMPMYFNILGSGVQVVVKKEDIKKAKKIVQIDENKITCPSCGSENIQLKSERKSRKFMLMFIIIFLVGLIGNLLHDYKCLDCKTEFRK